MKISPFIIYLISCLDNLAAVLILLLSCLVITVIVFLVLAASEDWEKESLNKGFKISLYATIVTSILFIFTPTENQMWLTLTVPTIVNSETVQKDLPELYNKGIKLLNEKLDSLTKEGKEDNK